MGSCGRRHGGAGRLLRLSNADLGSFVHHGTNFSDFGMLWTVSAAPFGGFHRVPGAVVPLQSNSLSLQCFDIANA